MDGRTDEQTDKIKVTASNESMSIGLFNNSFEMHDLNHRKNCFSFSIKVMECMSVCSIIKPKRPNHRKNCINFCIRRIEVCLSVSLFNNFSGMTEPIGHIIFGKIEKNHFNMSNKVICILVASPLQNCSENW